MELEEILQSTNSELRFITLELMKLAEKRGATFKEIAKEYVENVLMMQKLIDSSSDSAKPANADSTSD